MSENPKNVTIVLKNTRNHNGVCYEAGEEYTVDIYTAQCLQADLMPCEKPKGCHWPHGPCPSDYRKDDTDVAVIPPGGTVPHPVPVTEDGCYPNSVCYNYCGGCVFVALGTEKDPANINTEFPITDGTGPDLLPAAHPLVIGCDPVVEIQLHNADPANAAYVTLNWKC